MTDIARIIQDLEQQRKLIERALSALRELNGGTATASTPASTSGDAPRKRRLSAAGRKRIAEATRRRWANKRAAEASAAAAKKSAGTKTVSKKTAAKKAVAKSFSSSKKSVSKTATAVAKFPEASV